MNFTSISCRWTIEACPIRPEVLIRSLLQTTVEHLPLNSIGHVKGYAEFEQGAVFASSTIIPPDITLQQTGDYQGGIICLNIALIFSGLSREVLTRALESAREYTEKLYNVEFKKKTRGIDGD